MTYLRLPVVGLAVALASLVLLAAGLPMVQTSCLVLATVGVAAILMWASERRPK